MPVFFDLQLPVNQRIDVSLKGASAYFKCLFMDSGKDYSKIIVTDSPFFRPRGIICE